VVVSTGIAMEGSALVLAAAVEEQGGEMALSVSGHGAGCRVRPADALARSKEGGASSEAWGHRVLPGKSAVAGDWAKKVQGTKPARSAHEPGRRGGTHQRRD
jgi:hypothetical protein